jgi:glycosyltransferase involved in cell wall biosynthesis
MNKNNRFVFLMPCYNAEKTITQSLLSVISQSYSKWKIIIRDDMSTDDTRIIIDNIIKVFGFQEKISVKTNTEKKWEVANILDMLQECNDEDIVCRLDGDDWLTDLDSLFILNCRYNQMNVDAIWTAHRWSYTDQNISNFLPKDADPYKHDWVSSHFKTFRKKLINNVKDDNFKGSDGNYFRRIGDQAIYLPVLHNAKGNWHFEPRVMYHYTIEMKPETFQTSDAKFQREEGELLRRRGYLK